MLKRSIPSSGSGPDSNSYRIGDYVYVEYGSLEPYAIRRISELNRTSNGKMTAKVCCFYRRDELPSSLIEFADNHIEALLDDAESPLSTVQRKHFKHRELFSSNEEETIPSTIIRGKCSVLKYSAVDSPLSYLNVEDLFFFCYLYDLSDRTLLCYEGSIRVGSEFQAELSPDSTVNDESSQNIETQLWSTKHQLTDDEINDFIDKSRTVATLARTLESSHRMKNNALFLSAVSASRDATTFRTMDVLHENGYSLTASTATLTPSSGPILIRDQLENWSSSEADLFEKAVDKLGKDFFAIRQDVLPWKSVKDIVEYYYMWKTTDRYTTVKNTKAKGAESKFGRIVAPKWPTIDRTTNVDVKNKNCSNCAVKLAPGFWAPFRNGDVCINCRDYWKKHASLP